MKKILFVTGTRADYGKLKPLMMKVENSDQFECHIFATGMHTLARYGSTYHEIKKDGFRNIYLYINQIANTSSEMDMVLARTIEGMGHYIREFRPDMIVVHGDRVETLASAIVGTLNNIFVAHIEGGEISGTVDELIRHSVSKLSHFHFVANEEARSRLIQMGEEDNSIFVMGSPDIELMLSDNLPSLLRVKKDYEIAFEEYIIFSYHPVTTALNELVKNLDNIMDALLESQLKIVAIYPNNDRGADLIIELLEKIARNENVRLFSSMRFESFLTLLKNAKAIVGNSSAGVREAPVYGVPTINIGNRQMNRFHYPSIINIAETKNEILSALKNLPAKSIPSLHFGKGGSSELFLQCLLRPDIWSKSCQKQFKSLAADNSSCIAIERY